MTAVTGFSHRFFDTLPDEAAAIRQEVFVDEQGFENEFDDTDRYCIHLVLYRDGEAAAVGRLYRASDGVWHLGRIAVRKPFRGQGLGAEVMSLLERKAYENGAVETAVSAQCRAAGFYEKLGYRAQGEVYLDEFCEHILMVKLIRPNK